MGNSNNYWVVAVVLLLAKLAISLQQSPCPSKAIAHLKSKTSNDQLEGKNAAVSR